jgi:hypothetical protein
VRVVTVLVALTAGGLVAWLVFLQGDGEAEGGDSAQWTVEDARAFREFPLYWVGERFGEWDLSSIVRQQHGDQDTVTFVYGRCEVEPGVAGDCPPPLSIRIEPYCSARPELISDAVKQGEVFAFRGAQAQRMTGHLRIWSGDISVSLFGEEDVVMQAAQVLRPIDAPDQDSPYPDLLPPDPSGC